MQNLFESLKSMYQQRLVKSAVTYSSASSLIIKLKGKSFWSELTINEFNSFCTWADIVSSDLSVNDIKYGDRFLKKD